MSQNGKGDKRRPTQVDFDTYASNWDRVFSKKPPKTPTKKKAK